MIFLIGLIFGVNFVMVVEKVKFLRKGHNLKITLGAGIISVAAAGCASCGLSLVSVVGLGSALAVLPFRGFELYIASIVILLLSLYYNLSSLYKTCGI